MTGKFVHNGVAASIWLGFSGMVDFQLSREESNLQSGPNLTSEEVDHAFRDWISEKTRRSTQWAVSVFHIWCQVRGVKEKVEVLSVKKLSELLPLFAEKTVLPTRPIH